MKNEQDLVKFSRDWDESITENDPDKIATFISESWTIVGADGITSRQQFLDSIRSGDLTHHTMTSDELHVKIHENTGIITAKGTSAGTYKGISFSLYEWSTSVFILEAGRWKCVQTMLTLVN